MTSAQVTPEEVETVSAYDEYVAARCDEPSSVFFFFNNDFLTNVGRVGGIALQMVRTLAGSEYTGAWWVPGPPKMRQAPAIP